MSPKTRKIVAAVVAVLFLVGGTIYAGSIVLMSSGPRGEVTESSGRGAAADPEDETSIDASATELADTKSDGAP